MKRRNRRKLRARAKAWATEKLRAEAEADRQRARELRGAIIIGRPPIYGPDGRPLTGAKRG